jgi:hypothetical protein
MHMSRKVLFAMISALTVFSLAGLGAMTATASASTARVTNTAAHDGTKVILTASGGLAAGSIIRIPDGKLVTLRKDWSKMSIADLASIGIRPAKSGAVDGYVRKTGVRPDSAEGCSGLVCIVIGGSGRTIASWSTLAYPTESVCTFAVYWEPTGADILDTGNEVCGGPGGSFVGYLTYPVSHDYNYHACNTWVELSGKPCEYIHA